MTMGLWLLVTALGSVGLAVILGARQIASGEVPHGWAWGWLGAALGFVMLSLVLLMVQMTASR